MIYLDYSATTPVNDEVLESFVKCNKKFIGNPNSLHKLGNDSLNLINSATDQIKKLLNINNFDVIYTSGASEANNLALKGIIDLYSNRGNKIITSSLEHSSIYKPLEYLKNKGFEICYAPLNADGTVNLEELDKLIDDNTILVTISAVNSETGVLQPIDEIGKIINKYPKCYFHTDITQAIGKINLKLENVDLASFSSHKFYGLKGVGALLKKDKIIIEPLIHGGKSTTNYRSGTPALPLIVSTAKALRLALVDLDNKYTHISSLNADLRTFFDKYDKVSINSPNNAISHILNISIDGVKPESFLHALEKYNIYISTKSACSSSNSKSDAVFAITKSIERANSSLRISLSYLTTNEEIEEFKRVFDICYNELTNLR